MIAILTATACLLAAQDEAPWEEQLRELGFRLVRISSINVIQGLNLSRDQVVKLRELARQAAENGATAPVPGGSLRADIDGVRKAFLELEGVLLKGEAVSDDLRARIVRQRTIEAEVIARGLTGPRRGRWWGTCSRCHASPGESSGGFDQAGAAREMAYAHSVGAIGLKATLALKRRAEEVDALLTAGQKKVLSGFSCCLIPPQDLSDPVRVGQAALPQWQIDLLRKVREVPESSWPTVRERAIERLLEGAKAKKVHLPDEERQAIRGRLEAVFEKARGFSEVDFELRKEELCGELSDPARPAREQTAFERAFWLLMPGAPAKAAGVPGAAESPT
ncbi:MAG: hypothetical protein HYY16_08445 [Planctomycetes bacterium]|nr:hypothetical protein [Planctomycetota bacterium]